LATADAQVSRPPTRKGGTVVVGAVVVVGVVVVDTGTVVIGRVGSAEHATKTHKSRERRRMGLR
jgi:hypothetical protein